MQAMSVDDQERALAIKTIPAPPTARSECFLAAEPFHQAPSTAKARRT
jgi:hypothetical protein